ncbi:hypothetical protein U1839_26320 [Sphingomonas sp. RT2P30]|uniref:hypothetical protein n=1 Tax=Parasphingomonas halimpatiens TaxID=3096162 RepID=UPI002FC8DB8B
MTAPAANGLVLGFHPSNQGFGWIAFSGPFSIHHWGVSDMGREKNEGCLRKLERLLERLNPHTIVLEAYEGTKPARSERIVRLCRAVVAMAKDRGIEVAIYARNEIVTCFISIGAKTRYEIASAIARSFEILRDRLPAPRKQWETVHRRMTLFDAAALVLTHYNLGASQLFDDLLHGRPK